MNTEIDISNIKLETERLILRAWKITDLDDFFEYASINGVGEKAGWEHHKSKDESLEILKMFIDEKKVFAIVLKENRQDLDKNLENLLGKELGYVLSKDYWNNGIMTEAVSKVIEYCFKILKLNYLIATCFNYNIESKKVLEKLNFKFYKDIIIKTRYNTVEKSILMILKNN